MKNKVNFADNLCSWYAKNARDLPWRRTKDPYKIWISEIMLQQTTVATVIPYYVRWVKEFPTVVRVAQAPLQKILRLWQGLGYYARAKNIQKAAKIICREHQGKIPQTPDELRRLPGFGPYTTGAVLSIAFGQRYPIIDANVRRVAMRQLAIKGFSETKHDARIAEFLDGVMPQKNMSVFNQGLMELGALVCRSNGAACNVCPVKISCRAYEKGIQELIPQARKSVLKNIDVAIALIKRSGKYFIQKRPSKGLLADLWEFPGGKVEKGETPLEALKREVKEELRVDVQSAAHLFDVTHFYTQYRVKLHVFKCVLGAFPPEDKLHKWKSPRELQNFPMPSGSAKILNKLEKIFP